MHISPAWQRRSFSRHGKDDEQHAANEQQENDFLQLLKKCAPCGESGNEQNPNPETGKTLVIPEGPACLLLKQLDRDMFSGVSGWLAWRLTNGPLSGLEIEACIQDDEIYIRLKSEDMKKLQRLSSYGQRLARQFGRRVIIEVSDADSADQ